MGFDLSLVISDIYLFIIMYLRLGFGHTLFYSYFVLEVFLKGCYNDIIHEANILPRLNYFTTYTHSR